MGCFFGRVGSKRVRQSVPTVLRESHIRMDDSAQKLYSKYARCFSNHAVQFLDIASLKKESSRMS